MVKLLLHSYENPQCLVYTHLAKAGGNSVTTFLNVISQKYALSSLGVAGTSSGNSDYKRIKEIMSEHSLNKDNFSIILGHIPFASSSKLFPESLFTTTMREPEWQLISNYCSQPLNIDKLDFGMSDFIDMLESNHYAEWAIDNYQTRMLCDDPCFGKPATEDMLEAAKINLKDNYALVGFTENMEDYFKSLGAMYGLSSVESTKSPINVTGNYKPHVEQKHIDYARERNELDVSLYQWARDEFSSCAISDKVFSFEKDSNSFINVWINFS